MTEVYRHLRMGVWSIRERGLVVGHVAAVALRDVRLVVQPRGVMRVRARGQREVVAYARGSICDGRRPATALRVRFDPFVMSAFEIEGAPISTATVVFFEEDGQCWLVP